MASYVAAYRIGMLVSTAGALFLVSGFEGSGISRARRLERGLCRDGGAGADRHGDDAGRDRAGASRRRPKPRMPARRRSKRVLQAAVGAFSEFLTREVALVALAFVVLFKFTDALRRRDDGAVRDRSRLHPQRIRRDHQGRRPRRDADRRLCRRLRRARLSAGDQPLDRRHPAGARQPRVLLAGAVVGHESLGADLRHHRWRTSPAPSAP